MKKAVLLTVSGEIPPDIVKQIADGRRPRADYLELARSLDADLIDYGKARRSTGRAGRFFERIGGANLMLAYACWKIRRQYQAIATDGEQVGIPLAALLKLTPGKSPCHLMIVHDISAAKKLPFLDWLRVHSHIDRFFVYSRWQKRFIKQRWNMACERVTWTPFMVDQQFFSPAQVMPKTASRPQICAVGLERRDYPTLMRAVEGLDLDVVVAAASPWSKYKDSTSGQRVPQNVTVKKFSQHDLRQLYADSLFLVMPLEEVNFQAGVTAILEAMAMAKPVICSRAPGQTDVITENENGRYVDCDDPAALRAAIVSLVAQREEIARMGANGRRLIEDEMNLDRYAERFAAVTRACVLDRTFDSRAKVVKRS